MYINSKTVPELLEDPLLRDFYIRRHEISDAQKRENRKELIRPIKENLLDLIGGVGKWTVIFGGTLAICLLGSSLFSNKKDLSEILKSDYEVKAIIKQAEYQTNNGDLEKARALYLEAIKLVPDNEMGNIYKGNLQKEMLALRK